MKTKPKKTLEKSLADAIKSIKKSYYKGTYIKIELEAQLGRENSEEDCENCEGRGCFDCENEHEPLRNESGQIRTDIHGDNLYEISCDYCEDGDITCQDCDGSGRYSDREWDDSDCLDFIRELNLRLRPLI